MTSQTATRPLWIGTFPAEGGDPGGGEGIWRVDVDVATGRFGQHRLVVSVPSPTFLALHPSGRVLYAVSETDPGTVSAFTVSGDGALVPAGAAPSGGSHPCHVLAHARTVWLANYADGVAAALPVDADGAFGAEQPVTFPHAGSGPVADRQDGPHAHFVAAVGEQALVCDLGTDQVRRYALDAGAPVPSAAAGIAAVLPPGTGPRHLVELRGGALVVVGELDARLHVLVPDGEGWAPAGAYPASAASASESAPSQPSHVALSADGALLTVGARGVDVLAVHRTVGNDGGAPVLEHLHDVPLGAGAWPRHHAVLSRTTGTDGAGDLVVVANQGTSELACVRLDDRTGTGEVVDRLALPTPPACVLEA